MKKNLARLLALGMSIALVFSLAACGGNGDEPDTTDPSTEAITQDEGATNNEGDSTPVESGSDSASEGGSDAAPNGAVTKPASKDAAVSLYNSAVKKIGSLKATYSRTFLDGNLSLSDGMKVNLGKDDAWNHAVVKYNFDKSNAALPADKTKLVAVSAGDIASYTASESDNAVTIDFKLNTKSGSGLTSGAGGYMYLIDKDEAQSVIKAVANSDKKADGNGQNGGFALPGSISVESADITMSNGTLSVTIDKASGKIKTAKLYVKETLKGAAKYKILVTLNVTANISGEATVNYTAS